MGAPSPRGSRAPVHNTATSASRALAETTGSGVSIGPSVSEAGTEQTTIDTRHCKITRAGTEASAADSDFGLSNEQLQLLLARHSEDGSSSARRAMIDLQKVEVGL